MQVWQEYLLTLNYEQEQMIENEKLDVTVLHNISDVDTVL